jgi:hypothetical protein
MFARVLDVDGRFLQITESLVSTEGKKSVPDPRSQLGESPKPPFPLPVDSYRSANLAFPSSMSAGDLEILEKRLQFEIENGTLWRYLGLKKPVVNPVQISVEEQAPMSADNVVPMRPLREPG